MRQWSIAAVWGLVLCIMAFAGAPVGAVGLDPAFNQALAGPDKAIGAVVWNHGRSINTEDSDSPTPPYLRVLRDAGWDVLRFDRPREGDTLTASTRRLVELVGQLKRKGYRRIVLAGQSFGAFLALMAADSSEDVDAVVATAPAAFGNFDEFYDSWRLNATRLYPLLERVKRARVMLFYFHGDDFDPGGRGEHSRGILAGRQIGYSVIDQPAFLAGHWASSTGLFLRRFGSCIRDFHRCREDRRRAGLRSGLGEVTKLRNAPAGRARPPPGCFAHSRRGGRRLGAHQSRNRRQNQWASVMVWILPERP